MASAWWHMMWIVAIISVIVIYKLWMKLTAGRYKGEEKLTGKTVIVTGASAGIGAATAKDFAARGARVLMLCRDVQKGEGVKCKIIEETGNSNLVIKHVDFASLTSVRKCAEEILNEEKYIHILVNNAGTISNAFEKTEDGLDCLMQTNHFSPFLLTNILLGKIKESAPSRIVMVSSESHRLTDFDIDCLDLSNIQSGWLAYGNSKLCNILMTIELAELLKNTGVTTNSLNPGAVATEAFRDKNIIVRTLWFNWIKLFHKNLEEGAQTTIYCSLSPDLENVSGKYFVDCKEKKVAKPADDIDLAKKLWQSSEIMVKLQPHEKHY